MDYNYFESVTSDIVDYLHENREGTEFFTNSDKEKILDDLWIEDSVTGNASGSYTFNTAKARENLEGNEDLVERVVSEFWVDMGKNWNDYEYLDVSIRCLLISECLDDAIEQFLEDEQDIDNRERSARNFYINNDTD